MELKSFAYLFAHYFWVCLLGLCLISTIEFKKPIQTGDIYSNTNPDYHFDTENDPVWFLHFTDTHLSTYKKNYNTIYDRFNRSLSLFAPDQIFVTGDICDSFHEEKAPKYIDQMKEDWDLYKDVLKRLDLPYVPIHVLGNHDIFNVLSYDSEKNFGKGLLYANESRFLVERINFSSDSSNHIGSAYYLNADDNQINNKIQYNANNNFISTVDHSASGDNKIKNNNDNFNANKKNELSFIKINPYTFPTPSVYIIWWVSPSKGMRNKIFDELSRDYHAAHSNEPLLSIAACHIPARMWFPSFTDELSRSKHVRLYLSGHLHPTKPIIFHHSPDAVEIVGVPQFRDNEVGLIAVDNDVYTYHQMHLSDTKFAVLTNPSPDNQKSSLEHFNELTQIRAISFGNKKLNLSFTIDNGELQYLNCSSRKTVKRRLNDQFTKEYTLCTKEPTYSKGKHLFTKYGDWEGSFNFTVGEKVDSFEEENYFDEPSTSYLVCFFVYLVFAVIITIPFNFLYSIDKFDDWLCSSVNKNSLNNSNNNNNMNNSDNNFDQINSSVLSESGGNLYWILAVFGGFFVIKRRITKLPVYVKIPLFLAVILCIVFPYCFMEIEGKVGVYWQWGYIVGKESPFMQTPARFGTFYLIFVILPYILLISGLQFYFSSICGNRNRRLASGNNGSSFCIFKLFLFIDLCVYLAAFYYVSLWVKELIKYFGLKYGASSLAFVVVPIVLFILLVVYVIRDMRKCSYNNGYVKNISSVPLSKDEV